jgi:hypothetical protein
MPIIAGNTSLLVTQQAVETALTNDSTFMSLCKGVFDPALLNQAFPYAAFGEHIESNWYQFQRPSKQVEFVIHIYSQQPTFAEVMTILGAINKVIEAKTLALPGDTYTNIENGVMFLSATKVSEADGMTRHLECRWRIWNNAN